MIGLIADDLTGASDAGVQFTRAGLSARVLFEARRPLPHVEVDALAMDTDSRALTADAAYARVRDAAEALQILQPRHLYQKIDSTLRGNLGAEIDAMMDAFDAPLALVAPAFPALGRTTRGGTHYVRGTPVAETETARDPRAPVQQSNIVCLLRQQSRRTVGLAALECVAEGAASIRRYADAHDAQVLVCDAETDDHLRAIIDSQSDRADVVWVGSAGLAEQLAARVEPSVYRTAHTFEAENGPILLVCGSLSETTHRQVLAYCAQHNVVTVKANPLGLAAQDGSELERCRCELQVALERERDCAVMVASEPVRSADAAQHIATGLGQLGAGALQHYRLGGIILTGGDTARAVCHAAGVTGIDLLGEVEPGVPLGHLIGAVEVAAVTKAGAFGSDEALVRARQRLRQFQPVRKGASTR